MLKVPPQERNYPALICQVDLDSIQTHKYFVVPTIGNSFKQQRQLGDRDPWLMKGKKFYDLADFYDATMHVYLQKPSA
jgi:hypothetical protein